MKRISWILAILCCLAAASVAPAQHSTNQDRIDALVRKLGSASFVQREQAGKELDAVGPSALDSLRRAAKTADAETARRLAELITRFEGQLLTKQILAPKEIDLNLDGVTVQQAIADISSKSGYAIQFQGDATPFAEKKITLTGKMAFWQAFDKLCDQAGLMEMVELNPSPQPQPTGRIMRIRDPLPLQTAQAGPIRLTLRGKEKSLVSHAGSIKTELRISRDAKSKDVQVTLIISAEPSLLNSAVIGRPMFGKFVDAKGRGLQLNFETLADPNADGSFVGQRFTQARIKDDSSAVNTIKEMAGNLSVQLDLQSVVLAKMEKIMDSAGKSVNGVNGGSLKVQSVKKLPGDAVEIQASMENLTPNPLGNNIVINGGNVMIRGNINGNVLINGGNVMIRGNAQINGAGSGDLPDLIDAKGQKFKLGGISNSNLNFVNGSTSRTATIVFHPNPGQGAPCDLVLFGTRTHTIAVPFRFQDVPLP